MVCVLSQYNPGIRCFMSMTLKIKDSILSSCRHKLQRHFMKMLYSMILVARCKCNDNGVDKIMMRKRELVKLARVRMA